MKKWIFAYFILIFLICSVSAWHTGPCIETKTTSVSSIDKCREYNLVDCNINYDDCDGDWNTPSAWFDAATGTPAIYFDKDTRKSFCDTKNLWGDSCVQYFKDTSQVQPYHSVFVLRCLLTQNCPCISDTNDCSSGQTKCDQINHLFYTCVQTDNCWAWTTSPTSCALCSDNSCACTTGCEIGTKECISTTQNRTCVAGAGGCGVWSNPTNCPSGKTCNNGVCECPSPSVCAAGETKCSADGTGIQTCETVGSCPGWGAVVPCGSGQKCDATLKQCVIDCYPNCPVEYYWANEAGEKITSASIGDKVGLIAKTGIGKEVRVTFNISEDDSALGLNLGDDLIRTLLTADTANDGIARFNWTINAEDMESAKVCGGLEGNVAEFYFVESYSGKKPGDNVRSEILTVDMECVGGVGGGECIAWFKDTDEQEKQITYCSDYELIEGTEDERKTQCNLDCNGASGNEFDNYAAEYPDEIVSLYECGWNEEDASCNFYVTTGTGSDLSKCRQSVDYTPCEEGFRTVTYSYAPIGTGSCPESKKVEGVVCAASLESVLPFFSWQNFLAVFLLIGIIYCFMVNPRCFKNIYKVLPS